MAFVVAIVMTGKKKVKKEKKKEKEYEAKRRDSGAKVTSFNCLVKSTAQNHASLSTAPL